jgi:hypothetical protein
MKTWGLVAIAVLLMSFSSCEREKAVEPKVVNSDDVKQVLGNWRLVQPASGFAPTLAIDVDQYSGGTASGIYSLKLTGKAAVNSYFTSARLINWQTGSVEVENIGTTKMGGSGEAMQFEQLYYANLKAVTRYELTDKNQLRFYYDGGVLVYEK